MKITQCCKEDKSYTSFNSFMPHDIITSTEDILKIEIVSQDLIHLIFSFIIDYLLNETVSYKNANFMKSFLGRNACECSHVKSFFSLMIKIPRIDTFDGYCYPPNSVCSIKQLKEHDITTIKNNCMSKDALINSDHILYNHIALCVHRLEKVELNDMFKKWYQHEVKVCDSQSSLFSSMYHSAPDYYGKDKVITTLWWVETTTATTATANRYDDMFRCLLSAIYKYQNIKYLYDTIMHDTFKNENFMLLVLQMFNLPPHVIKYVVKNSSDVDIVNHVVKHQIYVDEKIIRDGFDSLTRESLELIISRADIYGLDSEILERYPDLLENIIYSNNASMDVIYDNRDSISEKCWTYISEFYDIPKDMIEQLSEFLDWGKFVVNKCPVKAKKKPYPQYRKEIMELCDNILIRNEGMLEEYIGFDFESSF